MKKVIILFISLFVFLSAIGMVNAETKEINLLCPDPIQVDNLRYINLTQSMYNIPIIPTNFTGTLKLPSNFTLCNLANNPPQFTAWPVIPDVIYVGYPYTFHIEFNDSDGDIITIGWYLDSILVSTTNEFIFNAAKEEEEDKLEPKITFCTFVGDSCQIGSSCPIKDCYTYPPDKDIKVVISDGKLSNSYQFSVNVEDNPPPCYDLRLLNPNRTVKQCPDGRCVYSNELCFEGLPPLILNPIIKTEPTADIIKENTGNSKKHHKHSKSAPPSNVVPIKDASVIRSIQYEPTKVVGTIPLKVDNTTKYLPPQKIEIKNKPMPLKIFMGLIKSWLFII